MTRLIDRLLREKHVPAGARVSLRTMPAFSIDNVAKYVEEVPEVARDVNHDFPNVAPPFEEWWMEFGVSRGLRSMFGSVRSVGFICYAEAWNAAGYYEEMRDLDGNVLDDGDLAWTLTLLLLLEVEDAGAHTSVSPPVWEWHFQVNRDGSLFTYPPTGDVAFYSGATEEGKNILLGKLEDDSEFVQEIRGFFTDMYVYPALFALSLLHCKNVVQRRMAPPDWQQKAALKKYHLPLVSYKVLEIEPMKTILRTEGKSEQVGLQKALHICRGHFKTYSDKPLFGKVKGTFWWPSTVRGSLSHGAVIKDYAVKAPRA